MKIRLDLIFQGVSATAALTIASLAVWGAFFTDIPEALIRQLRTDVSDAKEEVVDLRRERRLLEEQVAKTRDRLEYLRTEASNAAKARAELEKRLNDIHEKLASAQRDFATIKEERRAYLDQVTRIVVDGFIAEVERQLSALVANANMARQLPDFRVWVAEKTKYENLLSDAKKKRDFRGAYELIDRRLESIPEAWKSSLTLYHLTRLEKDADSDLKYLKNYENRLTIRAGSQALTGNDVIDRRLREARLDLLLSEDRKQLMNRYQNFVARDREVLSRPVVVLLPEGWSDAAAVQNASRVLQDIETMRTRLPELRSVLLLTAGER
ncbi:MAG: hypothetical protein HY521_12935 [Proteobacteria bacterium]|nr:hypothetical protein [Pseudomonadota bacterium]